MEQYILITILISEYFGKKNVMKKKNTDSFSISESSTMQNNVHFYKLLQTKVYKIYRFTMF